VSGNERSIKMDTGSSLRLVLLLCLGTIGSCHMPNPGTPVPVEGTRESVRALSGKWSGRYWSEAIGRHGTIRFTLPEQADTGYGEVEITFSPALHLLREASAKDELQAKPCTAIDIRLVRIEGGRIRGTMAPYWDPDCDCRATTVFEGQLSDEGIAGTFSTRRASADRRILTGKWQASRESEEP
jgi:hypothetical protein